MSDLVIDAVEMAKAFQWEIELLDDPVEVALKGQEACLTLRECYDDRIKAGRPVMINTVGAYMLRQWDEEEKRHITMQYSDIIASGIALGSLGFIQNLGRPHLQTIFLPVKSANVLPIPDPEDENDEALVRPLNSVPIPTLVIPVLYIQTVKAAA